MYYIKEDIEWSTAIGKFVGYVIISPLLLMIIFGALGSGLDIDILKSLGLADTYLIYIAAHILFNPPQITSWKVAESREEL